MQSGLFWQFAVTVTIKPCVVGVVYGKDQPTNTEGTNVTGVRCFMQAISGRLAETIFGRYPDAQFQGYFPPGTVIKGKDHVVVTAAPAAQSYLVNRVFSVKEYTPLGGKVIETILGKVDA